MQDNFPTEIDLCGFFQFGDCTKDKSRQREILTNVDITDNPILIKCQRDGETCEIRASQWKNEKLEEIDYETVEENEIFRQFLMVRLVGYIEIAAEGNEQSLKREFQSTRKKLAYGNILFQLQNQEVFIDSNNIVGMKMESLISDLSEMVKRKGNVVEDSKKKQKESFASDFQIVNIDCLLKKSDKSDKNLNAAMNFVLDNNKLLIPIEIDALAALHLSTKVLALYDILVESLCRTLRLIEENILDQLQQGDQLAVPQTYHFKPDGFGHFYTCVYPQSISDDDKHLTVLRKDLMTQFAISNLRPVFRRANQYQFDVINSSIIVNPHRGLKSTVAGGLQSLVKGNYTYHHYLQDKINDDGWGCAYRSLQTICSWFRMQGYTDHNIPSHEEIQKYLVKVGDKPNNFINSRQWIGSTEVSMCLNGFMNVDSKIMHVGSGADLASKGSELSYHFESQGTPIMIGGGVLAHTILGVDFNSNTGELKFLILDPHYTGTDDLQIVQNKGWCGWKGIYFWDKNSYYNLCMPQKPSIF